MSLNILWNSDRIIGGHSAYSKISHQCCTRLSKLGNRVAHIPMGMANRMGEQMYEDVLVYKSGQNPWNEDVALDRYNQFNADILIALKETWVFNKIHNYAINFVPYAAIDHSPVSPSMTRRFHKAFKVIVPSRFGQRELKKAGIQNVSYIPHGVDTNIYKVLEGRKSDCKKQWYIDPDDFTVLMVSMNRSRKLNPRQFRIYQRFREMNPDVKSHLLFWGNMMPTGGEGVDGVVGLGVSDVGVNLLPEVLELGLGEAISWPDANMIRQGIPEWAGEDYEGGWDMVKLYNMADALLHCTGGEGFGLPLIEAQACFTPETDIKVNGVNKGYTRSYSGTIINIETDSGIKCSVTPNHPFATPYGWIPAKYIRAGSQLIVGTSNGQKNMDGGTIKNIVSELRENTCKGTSEINESQMDISSMENERFEIKKEKKKLFKNEEHKINENRTGIYSGIYGRGWKHNNSFSSGKSILCFNKTMQLKQRSNGLVFKENSTPIYFHRREKELSNPTLCIQHQRNKFLPILPRIMPIFNCKEKTNVNNFEVDRKQTRSVNIQRLLGLRNGTYRRNTLVELETVSKVQRSEARDINVFNLGTLDGIYFANNFLVHNCGVPVVTTDYAAGPEQVGVGSIVPANDYIIINTPGVRRALPDIDKGAEALTKIMNSDPEKLARRARRYSMRFDWDRVIDTYFKPFLEECEGELYPKITKAGISKWR